jgi:hypothetical protein
VRDGIRTETIWGSGKPGECRFHQTSARLGQTKVIVYRQMTVSFKKLSGAFEIGKASRVQRKLG